MRQIYTDLHTVTKENKNKKIKIKNKSRMDHHRRRNEIEISPIPIEIKATYVSGMCVCVCVRPFSLRKLHFSVLYLVLVVVRKVISFYHHSMKWHAFIHSNESADWYCFFCCWNKYKVTHEEKNKTFHIRWQAVSFSYLFQANVIKFQWG